MARSGYTIIELLVIAGLLVLIASVTIPTYQILLAQAQLSVATGQVADLIRLQVQQTVTQQKIYGLTFVTDSTTIPNYLCTNPGCTTKSSTIYTLPNNIVVGKANFAANDINFSTAGAPNFSGTLTLKDTSRGKSRDIVIKPSGAVIDDTPEY